MYMSPPCISTGGLKKRTKKTKIQCSESLPYVIPEVATGTIQVIRWYKRVDITVNLLVVGGSSAQINVGVAEASRS